MIFGNRKLCHHLKYLFLFVVFLSLSSCSNGIIGSEDLSSKQSGASPTNSNPNLSPLAVSQTSVELFAGDDFRLTVTGGLRPYSFEDPTGNFNKSTFLYTAPQDFFSLGHVLKVFDSVGSSLSINFKVKNLENIGSFRSTLPSTYHSLYVNSFSVKDDGAVFVASNLTIGQGTPSPITGFVILKSTDGGSTFGTVYFEKGNVLRKFLLLDNGDFLLATEETVKAGEFYLRFKISKDQAASFTEISSFANASFGDIFIGKATNSIYLTFQKLNVWSDRIAHLYKSANRGASWNKISEFDYTSLTKASDPSIADLIELSATSLVISLNVSDYGSVANFADQWLVLKSTDSGVSWTEKDNVSISAGKAAYGRKLVMFPNGNILSIGSATASTNYNSTVTRLSVDGGNNWSAAETYNYASGKQSSVLDALIDANNRVWMIQSVVDSSNVYHALLRFSDDGINWTIAQDQIVNSGFTYSGQIQTDSLKNIYTVFTYSYLISGWVYRSDFVLSKRTPAGAVTYSPAYVFNYQSLNPKSAVQDANGNFIVASLVTSNTYGQDLWNVKISSDRGVTWNDSDNYFYPASTKTVDVAKIISTASDGLFVLGAAYDNNSYKHLIIRRGVPTSSSSYSWSPVKDSRETATSSEEPVDIIQSKTGRVFVAEYSIYSGYYRWIVKKSSADFSSWSNVEVSNLNSLHGYATGLSQDSLGRIYFVGYSSTTPATYFLRASDDDGVTWSTVRTWNNYNKNNLLVGSNNELFNVAIKGNYLYFEKSSDRGVTWSEIGQKIYDSITLNSLRLEGNNIFLFGKFVDGSNKSSVIRYSLSDNLSKMIDNSLNLPNLMGLKSFSCDSQTWCLLSSTDGTRFGEKIGNIRRMSK